MPANSPQRSPQPRTDFLTRDLVNQAAEFLSSMNVPAEVAIRTLVYPARRRS